jgi:transcriptional regulator with XRE-family HTH domain
MARTADKQSTEFARRFQARLAPLVADRQVEVAAAAGTNQQTLSNWVRGTAVKAENVVALAEALGVDLVWLLTGEDKHLPSSDINMSWLEAAIDLIDAATAGREDITAGAKAAWVRRAYELYVDSAGEVDSNAKKKFLALVKKR